MLNRICANFSKSPSESMESPRGALCHMYQRVPAKDQQRMGGIYKEDPAQRHVLCDGVGGGH